MRRLMLVFGLLAIAAAPGLAGDLESPRRIEAAGEPIDVDVGHAAPYLHDMDGDGLLDLLVGQMGKGHLRIYRNVGTQAAPRFEGYELFQAGGKDATVPSG